MKSYSPRSKIDCPYCQEKQEHPASYYVSPGSSKAYEEECTSCDQKFLVRQNKEGMILVDSNTTLCIYNN